MAAKLAPRASQCNPKEPYWILLAILRAIGNVLNPSAGAVAQPFEMTGSNTPGTRVAPHAGQKSSTSRHSSIPRQVQPRQVRWPGLRRGLFASPSGSTLCLVSNCFRLNPPSGSPVSGWKFGFAARPQTLSAARS